MSKENHLMNEILAQDVVVDAPVVGSLVRWATSHDVRVSTSDDGWVRWSYFVGQFGGLVKVYSGV